MCVHITVPGVYIQAIALQEPYLLWKPSFSLNPQVYDMFSMRYSLVT
jgi:hypothetical protein